MFGNSENMNLTIKIDIKSIFLILFKIYVLTSVCRFFMILAHFIQYKLRLNFIHPLPFFQIIFYLSSSSEELASRILHYLAHNILKDHAPRFHLLLLNLSWIMKKQAVLVRSFVS